MGSTVGRNEGAGRAGVRSPKTAADLSDDSSLWKASECQPRGGGPSRFQAMTVRIDVTAPDDPRGASVVANARLVGVDGLTSCRVTGASHRRSAERRRARSALSGSADRPRRRRGRDRRRHTGTGARGRGRTDAGRPTPTPANLNERRPISTCRRSGWSRLAATTSSATSPTPTSPPSPVGCSRTTPSRSRPRVSCPLSSPGRHPPMCGSTTCRSPS